MARQAPQRPEWTRSPGKGPSERRVVVRYATRDIENLDVEVLLTLCQWGQANTFMLHALRMGAKQLLEGMSRHDRGRETVIAEIRQVLLASIQQKAASQPPAVSAPAASLPPAPAPATAAPTAPTAPAVDPTRTTTNSAAPAAVSAAAAQFALPKK